MILRGVKVILLCTLHTCTQFGVLLLTLIEACPVKQIPGEFIIPFLCIQFNLKCFKRLIIFFSEPVPPHNIGMPVITSGGLKEFEKRRPSLPSNLPAKEWAEIQHHYNSDPSLSLKKAKELKLGMHMDNS